MQQVTPWKKNFLILFYIYILFPCIPTVYPTFHCFMFCSFLQSAINLCYLYIQGLSISPNILSVQHSISLPTVGNIHISTYFPRYDIIRQMTNSLLSPFVFPAFPSLLLFFSGVTTGQEGKYFSVSYSLIASHSNSIHTLYFNPSPHICLILLWLCMAMEFGLLCVCINQNKFCLSAYHVISQWILSHIAITQLAPILLICKNIFLDNIIFDTMSLNKVVFLFFKSNGDLAAGEIWRIWLYLHCSKVSGPHIYYTSSIYYTGDSNWPMLFLQGVLQRAEVVTQQHPISPRLQPVHW